jgi:RNA polymerase sigma-70 factor (sigma-E family)
VRARDDRDFTEFVQARLDGLRRFAYLLAGDPHRSDDVVSAALAKLYRHWGKVSRLESPDGYLRRMLITTYLDEKRRPWRHEYSVDELPEPAEPPSGEPELVDRLTLMSLLERLPPRRRAVLVLRYFEDLTVEQTAEVLGCAPGTVKAHTHHALAALRDMLDTPLTTTGTGEKP